MVKLIPVSPEEEAQVFGRKQPEVSLPGGRKLIPVETYEREQVTPSSILSSPDRMEVVDKFLLERFGVDEIRSSDPEDRLKKFLNTMRHFSGGNSVRTLREYDYIQNADEDQRATYGEGMELFESLEGVFSGDYSVSEKAQALGQYTYGALADPVNLAGPLIGKALGRLGSRGAASVAREMSSQEFRRQLSKGASREVAEVAANKVWTSAARGVSARGTTREIAGEIAVATAFESLVSVGVDRAYQIGMITLGRQEEINKYQSGLAALGGLMGGAIAGGGIALRGTSGNKLGGSVVPSKSTRDGNVKVKLGDALRGIKKVGPDAPDAQPKPPKNNTSSLDRFGQETSGSDWKIRVDSGGRLKMPAEQQEDFWRKLVLGVDGEFEGLSKALLKQGYRFRGAEFADDKVTNWLADGLKNLSKEDSLDFMKAFKESFGVNLNTRKRSAKEAMERLGDQMASTLNTSAKTMQIMSQVSRDHRGIPQAKAKMNTEDVLSEKLESSFGRRSSASISADNNDLDGLVKNVGDVQDTYTRLLTAHPGTSVLNIKGWAMKSAAHSAADLLRGTALLAHPSTLVNIMKDGLTLQSIRQTADIYASQVQKMRNLLDPSMTVDTFQSIVGSRPDLFREMTSVLPGGVTTKGHQDAANLAYGARVKAAGGRGEVTPEGERKIRQKVFDEFGVDPRAPVAKQILDDFVDTVQFFSLVKAQDVLTKAQEFVYNLDYQLRRDAGMTLKQMLSNSDNANFMNSEEFTGIAKRTTDAVLENILSKSYANTNNQTINFVAKFIEDFRRVPIVGVTIPFGRFFNNTMATISQYSGATLMLKGFNVKGVGENLTHGELLSRAAVGWTAVGLMVPREEEYIEKGLSWYEDLDEKTGETINNLYDFPWVSLKAMSRILAHRRRGEEPPAEMLKEMGAVHVSQLTRQLEGFSQEIVETANAVIVGDIPVARQQVVEMLGVLGVQAVSGSTRFLEPINVLNATQVDPQGETYAPLDSKQGRARIIQALRYVDQFYRPFTDFGSERASSATQPYVTRQPDKILGFRGQGPETATEKAMAMAGIPDWMVGIKSDSPETNNLLKKLIFPILEDRMSDLYYNEKFRNAPTDVRETLVREALSEARDATKSMLERSSNPGDRELQLIYDMTGSGSGMTVDRIEGLMRDLDGFSSEKLEDLPYSELKLLKEYLSQRDEMRAEEALR